MNEPFDWPPMIRSAVESLDGDLEWQVFALVCEEPKTADELVDELDISHRAATTSVSKLTKGGIVNRRNRGELTDEQSYTVELSEYGLRLVDALFDTLGEIEEPKK